MKKLLLIVALTVISWKEGRFDPINTVSFSTPKEARRAAKKIRKQTGAVVYLCTRNYPSMPDSVEPCLDGIPIAPNLKNE